MSPPIESLWTDEAAAPQSLSLGRIPSVLVIGAGISGLACAHQLTSHGFQVQVVEKGRGPGGRIATRREEVGGAAWQFDHGAQYFTVRDADFVESVGGWVSDGTAAVWHGRIAVLGEDGTRRGGAGGDGSQAGGPPAGGFDRLQDDTVRYVGVPTMNALARSLAGDCAVAYETRVETLERRGRRWAAFDPEGTELGRFDIALAAVPAPRAEPLLRAVPALAARAGSVRMAPTWAALLVFDEPLDLPFDGAFVHGSPLSWVACNSSKPGRPEGECWVLHGAHDWSFEHLEDDAEEVLEALRGAFARQVGRPLPEPVHATAHRWRHAAPEEPLPERCLWDGEKGLGACGDWCGGSRVEGAYLSGRALGQAVASSRGPDGEPA